MEVALTLVGARRLEAVQVETTLSHKAGNEGERGRLMPIMGGREDEAEGGGGILRIEGGQGAQLSKNERRGEAALSQTTI